MTRRGRSALGAVGGILWGAGAAVLIQQYGLWPLDAALAYGAPLAGAVLSGGWGRVRSRRHVAASAAVAIVALPLMVGAYQPARCTVMVPPDGRSLATTSPTDPILIDPEVDDRIQVEIQGNGLDGRPGEVWIEFGGIRTFVESGTAREVLMKSFSLRDNGFADLGGAPGIYHVGGSIEGICSVDGYVRIAGNPMTGPVGPAAGVAVLIGTMLTLVAGRPPKPSPTPIGRTHKLRPNGKPVEIGDVEIRSPSLEGDIEVHAPTDEVTRRVARWSAETREALARHHLEPERIIEITDSADAPHPAIGREIVSHHGAPALQLDLPNPGSGKAQIILATDESGVATWHFPRLDTGAIDTMRTGARCTYRMRRYVAPSEAPERRRGIAEAFGAKVLSSLVFPLLDPVFGRVGDRLATAWETKRRPYRFRTFTPSDYHLADAAEPDWDRLAGGKALLFVHGTFSRAHTGFAGLSAEVLADLDRFYGGRVFAFDHFTLSDDPRRNVAWFFDHLPSGIALDVDIVCHSRGGLVSRVLAEKQGEVSTGNRRVDVGKIVFVASPNAGTILTEPTYIGDYIDSYTNLMNFVPGDHVVDLLEGLVTVVKHVAVGAACGLDGLAAMQPDGEFLRWLNTTATNPSRYFAVAGDYEPQLSGWRSFATNRLMDQVFHEANDLVVPTAGTFAPNGSSHFPIRSRHEIQGEDGVDHTGYFDNTQVRDRLLEWLRE